MSARKTELQLAEGAAADDDARANGEGASPEPTPEEAAPATPVLESAPRLAEPEPIPPAAPAWQDFPVASVLPPVAPLLPPTPAPSALEDRIHRLEAELNRLRSPPPARPYDPASAVVRQPGRFWGDLGKRLLAPSAPAAAPAQPDPLASMVPPGVRRTWLLIDALTEVRAIYWMFFDPRYRLSWVARLTPIVLVAMILTSAFWMPATSIPIIGTIFIDKIVDLILAYVLFKLLSHEARRYRETAPDLPPGLRQ